MRVLVAGLKCGFMHHRLAACPEAPLDVLLARWNS